MLAPPDLLIPTHLTAERADPSRSLAYADGAFLPLAEATVSMRDHGFMYADMTYDVLQVWRGGIFRLEDHLDRFFASLAGLRLDPGLSREEVRGVLRELVRRSGLDYALLYLCCTRGETPPGIRDPARARQRLLANITPLVLRGQPAEFRRGWHARIVGEVRRIPPDSVNPRWKNSHWGDLSRALWLARDAGYDTAILLGQDGNVAEGPGFNVVALTEEGLLSPAEGVLEGIACRTMFEIAARLGIPARYGTLSPEALQAAKEAFATMTSTGLFPITRIDGRPVGEGVAGPVTVALVNEYYRLKDAGWHITPAA
ncbi:MAG: aminotransferase class IV [Acetobacteraceae bacterium]|nr:aminotransferase class IV [Acetobacteraceae bacterium]MDW8397858.1 aminotransferase class IV [Acetobacteraceae bacterium]